MLFIGFFILYASFTLNYACVYNGKTIKNGEEWTEKDVFIMRCDISNNGSWKTKVTACVTPKGEKISINETKEEGRSQWTCTTTPDGRITLQHGANPNAKCDGDRDVGAKWVDRSFEFECTPGSIPKLLSCIGDNSEKIPVGESKEINGYEMHCKQFDNGTIILHGKRKTVKNEKGEDVFQCLDAQGKSHLAGESWIENGRFSKKCMKEGHIEIEGCVTQDGQNVPVNGDLIVGDTKHICEKTGDGAIRYSAAPK